MPQGICKRDVNQGPDSASLSGFRSELCDLKKDKRIETLLSSLQDGHRSPSIFLLAFCIIVLIPHSPAKIKTNKQSHGEDL